MEPENEATEIEKYIDVPIKILNAVMITAAKMDVRYYLMGLRIDIKDNDCHLVTTNGHQLSYCKLRKVSGFDGCNIDSIIGSEFIKTILSTKHFYMGNGKKLSQAFIRFYRVNDGWRVQKDFSYLFIKDMVTNNKSHIIDWRRVIPKTADDSINKVQIQVDYLIGIQKIAKFLGVRTPSLVFFGDNRPATANFGVFDEFEFNTITMPMRE